jgi:hypothetical protein
MTRTRSAGAHYTQVSKWLGHESYVTTLTIYAAPASVHPDAGATGAGRLTGTRPVRGGATRSLKISPQTVYLRLCVGRVGLKPTT